MSTPPTTLTRQQRYMTQAVTHVQAVKDTNNKEMQDIYGGLCHSFPVLVRSAGLCQALAFVEAKAAPGGSRGEAYRLLKDHVADTLEKDANGLLDTVRMAGVTEYMRYTRAILAAWIFYKRFAVSILDVATSGNDKDGADL